MKKIILLLTIFFTSLYSYKTDVKAIFAIGIFNENGSGENIQHLRKTESDYNGTCYTKIFVYGTSLSIKPEVSIGSSKGYFQKSTSIYDKRKIKIGEEMLFKHYNVSNGLIKVTFRNKLFDSKVYVK